MKFSDMKIPPKILQAIFDEYPTLEELPESLRKLQLADRKWIITLADFYMIVELARKYTNGNESPIVRRAIREFYCKHHPNADICKELRLTQPQKTDRQTDRQLEQISIITSKVIIVKRKLKKPSWLKRSKSKVKAFEIPRLHDKIPENWNKLLVEVYKDGKFITRFVVDAKTHKSIYIPRYIAYLLHEDEVYEFRIRKYDNPINP